MNANRIRLINAARNALFQRAQLKRSAERAHANFVPRALKARATSNILRKAETAAETAERGLRKYSLPLGLAALAGLTFAFRRPLGAAASIVMTEAEKAIKSLSDNFTVVPTASPQDQAAMEQTDEPV